MAKRKTDNSYQCDSKRFSVPLPDFSVPPPGFNSAPFTSQNFQSNWFSGPAQQQQQASYGFYNYNAAETSNFANASAFFWTPNKPRNFQNAQQTRPSVIPNLKLRGRGRGRAPGRGNDSYINKSPRSSNSSGGAPQWFPNSMNNSNSRFSNTYSNDNDRISESGSINDEKNESKKTIVNKKGKRKSMSQKYSSKPWDLESAEKAVAVELEYNRLQNTQSLILKFPDAELNKEIVKNFNSNIEHVHFQQPSTPRYCFVQLCEGADVDSVQNQLREVTFGGGKITVEKKINQKSKELAPEKIDPYTLYVGNLPTNITAETVKAIYPTAFRVDIGYAQKMKYTRYAFISYQSAEAAIKAFKDTHSLSLESRSIIVRFRRHKGAVGLPGQSKTPGHLSEEAVSKSAGNTKQQSKKSSLSMTDDGDIGGSDLHDGPMEIDEDDYDIPYHDDLDEHYNSDFDDSLFDNLRSSSKECKRSNKDEISTSRNSSTYRESLSKTNKSQQLRENTSSMSASDILKSKENEEISANDAAKKNVEQQIEELIPNVITQLLKSSEIKQEPLEKDNMEQLLQNQFPDLQIT
ncbi:uncharacterized protein LOC113375384 [Ctenocephalides felis]|uniref:uncharacterized protein LOC113375384 n=1 Tax=Ctenocephalides felis TaxID=7515 RepID=UPI000E6E4ABA|nr:uncharacterized protein LOC113375384 [Ctenocephalides felis]